MRQHEMISQATNTALLEAAARYFETVVHYDSGDDIGFMTTYLGREPKEAAMTIAGDVDTLTINMYGDRGDTRRLLTIDLHRPDGAVATLVAPGMYAKHVEGNIWLTERRREPVRTLTQKEGEELAMDLHARRYKAPTIYRKAHARHV